MNGKYIVPHKLRGIRRRRGKVLVIGLVVVLIAATTSWVTYEPPKRVGGPDMTELMYRANESRYSPALVDIYTVNWPEYSDMFYYAPGK